MELTENEKAELVKKVFKRDLFAAHSELEITGLNGKEAVVEAAVSSIHLNANGVVQGGMLFTMADLAFAALTNYVHPMTVSQCASITFLRPASGKRLRAVARETARNGHNCVGEVRIENDAGEIVSVASFNGFIREDKAPQFSA